MHLKQVFCTAPSLCSLHGLPALTFVPTPVLVLPACRSSCPCLPHPRNHAPPPCLKPLLRTSDYSARVPCPCPPAACGFVGTLVGKRLIQSLGLLRAGGTALAIHATLLCCATGLYYCFLSGPPELGPGSGGLALESASGWPMLGGVALPVVAFATLVVMSRIGVWSFDMVNSQLFQQTVAPREMASASSAEMALCSFSELLMLGTAALSADPASFTLLVYTSLAAILAANLLFRWWARRAQPAVDGAIANAAAA